ncbi:nucleotide-binding protein [Microbacterium sp. IEGM 1404]|uniref:nucleotide-binding protein n=1 Tax=Microbacterium sp. IEGM 1404 TaxID=3047084 RepID=UPI0024B8072D|nr:MinD/ParA family protein [Microbacterium sp. IEGM 1404]MDI9892905.1 AAA family ATPase [Microbacterium sp. IEGM 1404]
MTPDRTDETPDDGAEHGVLDDSGNLDTTSISILGEHIAQVNVDLPVSDDDDVDDDVVEDEMPVIDPESRAFEVVGIVHVPDADELPLLTHVPEPEVAAPADDSELGEPPTGDIVLEPHEGPADDDAEVHEAEIVHDDDDVAAEDEASVEPLPERAEADAEAEDASGVTPVDEDDDVEVLSVDGSDDDLDAAEEQPVAAEPEPAVADADSAPVTAVDEPHDLADGDDAGDTIEPPTAQGTDQGSEQQAETREDEPGASVVAEPATEQEPAADPVAVHEPESVVEDESALASEPVAAEPQPEPVAIDSQPASPAATDEGDAPAPSTGPVPRTRAELAATGVIGTVPLTRREVHQADEAARVGRVHATERVRTPGADVTLASKRLGEIDDTRESPDLLTADRLLDPRQIARPEPEGLWQQLVYSVSRHRINLGDGRRARARKDLDRRIGAPLAGEARFVPVLSRKGGVGKTTVTSLLGMALADARDDRVIAVDANPDRGTLADRVGRANGRTVRDLVRAHDEVEGYSDVSSIVARDSTRLDVLASDSDPRVSEAFSDEDYRRVADVAAHYYSIVLTDTGTGIVHSVMEATLELADSLVVVAGLSVDEARLASETLTWLETNGYAERVRGAVVVLNNARPGVPLVRESELEAHFRSRVRAVIRMPYDSHVAAGSAIAFRDLQPATRQAARELAAAVVEGLRTPAAVA